MISYDELLLKYNELLKENMELKEKLSFYEPKVIEELSITTKVHNHSTPQEKINLFKSVFKGRADVYAKRWHSTKTGKSGYQPVCENEWDIYLCDKKKFKCNVCPNRKLARLIDKILYKHLEGKDDLSRDVIGIYPMLEDETCYFLAVDFDDGNYKEDCLAFKKSCAENDIPVYIERSRSGTGAHAWIFFESKISALLARRLGSGLLTYTMNNHSEIKFSSYDRLFPNQDIMPNGGFGNLIALPLQGKARKKGNSVFVDDDFIPCQDQWAYLSNIKKLSENQVEQLVPKLCKNSDLGVLIKDDEPWNTVNQEQISSKDFPDNINIVKSNMLYIEKNGISPTALNRIKRLGAFKNPDFYKAQAMRLSTYNKPRIICTTEETEKYIALPRGAENSLVNLLNGISYIITDKLNYGNKINVEFNGELRENQILAVNAMLNHDNGVLSATTAFGKTVVAANIIAEHKTNTLILVHSSALLTGWKKSLSEFLTINEILPIQEIKRGRKKQQTIIGELGSGKNNLNDLVDVAIMQSLVNGDEVKELVRNYGQIIVDECHHVSAVNFEKIMKCANAKYVYGLTATPTRADGHQAIIFLQCGDIRYKVNAKLEAEKRDFEHFVIPRFTGVKKSSIKDENNFTEIYGILSKSISRNNLIANDVINALENGRNPIILTERTEHIYELEKLILPKFKNIICLSGSFSAKRKRENLSKLQNIPKTEQLVIIASGKYVGEGFDFPRLDTLFLAMPIAWKGKVSQYAGRLHRNYEGKKDVLIYDYIDFHIPVLDKMYHKRLKAYSSIGYKVKVSENTQTKTNIIYDSKNYYNTLVSDLENARKSVVISTPFINKVKLKQLLPNFSKLILNGTIITIITKDILDVKNEQREKFLECIDYLNELGIKIEYKSNLHQKFIIIDENIVWYGSVNMLSYNKSDESIIRLENEDIANEFLLN